MLLFYVNGKKVQVDVGSFQPEDTLLHFLRHSLRLTGTKLGCGEGGCGACSVVVSKMDPSTHHIEHRAVNACLTPLCAVDLCSVTTIEGLGSVNRNDMHPVQKTLAEFHGSQCGFCTPGIVMALFAILQQDKPSTMEDIEHQLDGNLCRCTGYRPILDAAKSFGSDAIDTENDQIQVCGKRCRDCDHRTECDIEDLTIPKDMLSCSKNKITNEIKRRDKVVTKLTFPKELANIIQQHNGVLTEMKEFQGSTVCWHRPVTLEQLLKVKSQFPAANISVGNTEIGIETKFKSLKCPHIINVAYIKELHALNSINSTINIQKADKPKLNFQGIEIGAAVSLTKVSDYLAKYIKNRKTYEVQSFMAMKTMLKWFASLQIRNVACLGGNLGTASPISDMNPVLACCNAIIKAQDSDLIIRYIPVKDFFLGYRKVDLRPTEIIVSILVPYTTEHEYVVPFKQAKRREDDISIVTAGFRIKLEKQLAEDSSFTIDDISLVYGGMAPTTKAANNAMAYLLRKPFAKETFLRACDILIDKDFNLLDSVPGGMAKYRQSLSISFLYKFYLILVNQLDSTLTASGNTLAENEVSGGLSYMNTHRSISHGVQEFRLSDGGLTNSNHTPSAETKRAPVGLPIMHKSAYVQVTGEAKYTDDMDDIQNVAHGAFVLSTIPRGRIVSMDVSKALATPGVVAFYDASHFNPTKLSSSSCISMKNNKIGPVLKDEECFVSVDVYSVGQPLGIIIAETHALAMYASELVKVEYEPLSAILSIDDAIKHKSFHGTPHILERGGSVETGFENSEVIVEGAMYMGGQEHFYLETNVTYCIPMEEDRMQIYCSTQACAKTQSLVAHVLNIDSHNVTVSMKRMGGGFGGKETRSVFISCGAAIAAKQLNRPVRVLIERHIDMLITGGRHPFKCQYKLGAMKSGKLVALDIQLFNNAGFSLDLSEPVMDRALFHCENAYYIPYVKAVGRCCKTNLPTNTAFRGFGGPQGMFMAETFMDHLAKTLSMDCMKLRGMNLYENNQATPYGQVLEEFDLRKLWNRAKLESEYESRQAKISEFNKLHIWRKKGIAILPTKFGISFTAKFMNQGGALVHVYADGSVLVSHGGTEMGQGLHTKMIQIVARAFNIPHSKVLINDTSTDKVANSQPSAASMSTDLYGMACLHACEQILERLKPIQTLLPPDATFRDITTRAYFERINLSAQGFYVVPGDRCGYDWTKTVTENTKIGRAFNYYTTGVCIAEIEMDVLTGDCHMHQVDIYMDIGNSINFSIDIGQIEGAFMQGFGLFTMEEHVWGDDKHAYLPKGSFFTRGPGNYKIPGFNDVPLNFNIWIRKDEMKNSFAVHSSKAIGEPPLFLGATVYFAIKDALYNARKDWSMKHGADASGTDIRNEYFTVQSPLTPERIRMACNDVLIQKVLKDRLGTYIPPNCV